MTHLYLENGKMLPLTLIKVYDNCVIDVKESESQPHQVTIAFDKLADAKKIKKPLAGIFTKKSLPFFRKIKISNLVKKTELKVGDSIELSSILKKGDKVGVTGISMGKGFAGAMKRHGFAGLEASHGVSVSHRSPGSTGQRQDPGKVFKGKKMPGHMGVDKITVRNLEVIEVDQENSVIAVKGAVPGNPGADVILRVN